MWNTDIDVRGWTYYVWIFQGNYISVRLLIYVPSRRLRTRSMTILLRSLIWFAKKNFSCCKLPSIFFSNEHVRHHKKKIARFRGLAFLNDVRANCFCASLLRTKTHSPRHTRARALRNNMNNDRADGHCHSFAWIWRSWTFGEPYLSLQNQILFTIISTLSKNEQKINV